MRRRTSLLLVIAASAATSATWTAIGSEPAHAAPATQQVSVSPIRDAWYATTQTCAALPVGCGSDATTTSYPAGTLHVGVTAGQEAARSYITFAPAALAPGTTVSSGQLTMPVATDGGTSAADIALIELCMVPGGLANPAPTTPPTADCATSSPATYLGGAAPYFVADLMPFLTKNHGSINGLTLAIVPQPVEATAVLSDTWHVSISGAGRSGVGIRHITADLDTTSAVVTASPQVSEPSTATPPLIAQPPLQVPQQASTETRAEGPQVANPPLAASPVQRVAFLHIAGHRYGLVWGVPLALFGLAWAFVNTSRKSVRSYVASDQ